MQNMRVPSVFLYVVVFATGAAGLIFQVTWQKYVSRLLGSDSIATAIILGTFLGGLSLGYYLCGKLSARVRNHFKAYAVLEGVIGLWCLSFPTIFQVVDSLTRSWSFAPPALIIIQGILCSALLMGIPTICMGGTIPFLTRGISRNVIEATNIHANIYAINTAGAFSGTLLAGFYLIPTHGLPLTIMGTSFLNLGACLFFYLLSGVLKPGVSATVGEEVRDESASGVVSASPRFPAWILYSIAFLSGFYVMTLENVLIRITNFSIGSSSYSFSLIVAVFILAIALGSSVVGRFHRIRLRVLFINQMVITLSLLGIYLSLDTWPYWAHLIRIAFQSNIVGFWGYYGGVFFALMVVLLLPVAFMGATIPLAFHELKRDLHRVGTHSGMLFSWNTLGNLTGSLIGGIGLYYFLNNVQVFLAAGLLAACSTSLAGWYVSRKYGLLTGFLAILIFLGTIFTPFYHQKNFTLGTFYTKIPFIFSLEGPQKFFERFNAKLELKFYEDDPTGTVAVVESAKYPAFDAKPLAIVINGKSDSSTIGDIYTLKLLAHLPALLAEIRKNVLIIGLGTGVTASEFTLYPDVEQIDIAEISPAVVKALPFFQEFTHRLENDPRTHIQIGDAFRILGRSEKRWDIIVSEPSNPRVTGVDLLFTQEFYKLAREHLTEKGILLQWVQLYDTDPHILGMILNTIHQEFPHCRALRANIGDLLIIASTKHFSSADVTRAEETFYSNARVKTSLETINFTSVEAILIREIWTSSYIAEHFSDFGIQPMDNPRLHYMAGKRFFIGTNISNEDLFSSASLPYQHEYLIVQKYKNWETLQFSREMFASLLRSIKDKVSGNPLPIAPALKLKAYLSNPAEFPLSEQEKETFNVKLLPFIANRDPEEPDWSKIGLASASFREKAQILLQHVQTFRNWIVPYPIDGLQALLQEGISQGRDDYERNWCALQLAVLLLQERRDQNGVNAVLSQIIRKKDGTILIRDEDQGLLRELERLLDHSKKAE